VLNKLSLFDIVKSAALIAGIIFVYTHVNTFIDALKGTDTSTEPQIIKIDDTAIKIELAASKARLEKLEALLLEQESTIVKYARQNNEKIDELAQISAKLEQTVKKYGKSDKIYDGKEDGDPNKYFFKKIYMKGQDEREFPAAWVMYYPNREEGKQWKSGTYPLEFDMNIVESESKDGTLNRYAELWAFNDQMKEVRGERFPIAVNDVKWEKAPLGEKSFMFNMRIAAYANAVVGKDGEGVFAPGLGVSFFSYGRTKRDMDWKFLSVGGAYNGQEGFLFIEPASWNIGNVLPLVENVFVGPIGGMNTEGEWSLGVGFSIPF